MTEIRPWGYLTQQEDEFNMLTYSVPIKYYPDTKAAGYDGGNWDLVMYSQEFNSSLDRYILFAEENPVAQNDIRINLCSLRLNKPDLKPIEFDGLKIKQEENSDSGQ